jgi:hypothetical protein
MAESDDTHHNQRPQIGGQGELTSLAQRLRARADSVFFRDQPVQQVDLHTAANAVEELIRLRAEIRRAADATEDESTERHLREMLGGL